MYSFHIKKNNNFVEHRCTDVFNPTNLELVDYIGNLNIGPNKFHAPILWDNLTQV